MSIFTSLKRSLLPALFVLAGQFESTASLPEGMGQKVATLEVDAVRLISDPVRPRVYAITRSNQLLVFNTLNQQLIKTLPVGSFADAPCRIA